MSDSRSEWGVGFAFFAGFMLMIVGVFDLIQGFAALFKKDFYAVSSNYVFHFDSSTWGWIHMLIGLVVLLAGLGILRGAVWARTVGVIVAIVVAVENFMFIPIYPVWSIIIIAVAVTVIWALTAHGRDMIE
jgi:dolichyl-phosphate-mannose--protein O-mannosyl transferase